MQTLLCQPRQHPLGVGKHRLVPLKVARVQSTHPEAVEVEDMQRYVACTHAVDKVVDGGFVVIGRKRRGQPQAERPGRRQGWPAGQPRVTLQHELRFRAINDKVFQRFAFDAELRLRDVLRADLERNQFRMIDEQTPAFAGEKERDVLVGLFGAGAAIAIPDFHALPVLGESGKALAEAIHCLAHR